MELDGAIDKKWAELVIISNTRNQSHLIEKRIKQREKVGLLGRCGARVKARCQTRSAVAENEGSRLCLCVAGAPNAGTFRVIC